MTYATIFALLTLWYALRFGQPKPFTITKPQPTPLEIRMRSFLS